MEDYHCIVCDRPLGQEGFFGSIMEVKVSLCKEHAEECNAECKGCAHATTCVMARH